MERLKETAYNPKTDKQVEKWFKSGPPDPCRVRVRVFRDERGALRGFYVLELPNKLQWIRADPGLGKQVLKSAEKWVKKSPRATLYLKCSVDPTESQKTVMRRMNFYARAGYKVYEITWRKKYGPLLHMAKKL